MTSSSCEFFPPTSEQLVQLGRHIEEVVHQWGYLRVIPSYLEKGADTRGRLRIVDGSSGEIAFIRNDFLAPLVSLVTQANCLKPGPERFYFCERALAAQGEHEMLQLGVLQSGMPPYEGEGEILTLTFEILKSLGLKEEAIFVTHTEFLESIFSALQLQPQIEKRLRGYMMNRDLQGLRRYADKIGGGEFPLDFLAALTSFEGSVESGLELKAYFKNERYWRAWDKIEKIAEHMRKLGIRDSLLLSLLPSDGNVFRGFTFQHKAESAVLKGGEVFTESSARVLGFVLNLNLLHLLSLSRGGDRFVQTVDFLIYNQKGTLKSALELAKVLREHGYSVICESVERTVEESLHYAKDKGIVNVVVLGDFDVAKNEVRVISTVDQVSVKVSLAEFFDPRSGFTKVLRYQKRGALAGV